MTGLCVVIATKGRPGPLGDLLDSLGSQTEPPDQVVISATEIADLPPRLGSAEVVMGSAGLSVQRNRGLNKAREDCSLVAFFDDDAVLHVRYLEVMRQVFADFDAVVGAHGAVLADGAKGVSAVPLTEALQLLSQNVAHESTRPTESLYGCNMVVRRDAALAVGFDEELPLYSWLEDLDFSLRLRRLGELRYCPTSVLVHRGVKSGGRVAHYRFGYSQIANPVHLVRKNSIRRSDHRLIGLVVLPVVKNYLLAAAPGPQREARRLRAAGNSRAVLDLLSGRLDPGCIELFE